jgi:hypothetical protein
MGIDQPEYKTLHVRDVRLYDSETGEDLGPAMDAIFYPTQSEIDRIVRHEPVRLRIMGTGWPPVLLGVGREEMEPEE